MATFLETLAERTAAQRGPIAGDTPVGADMSFDPDFERVKAELDKLTGMTGGQPNWREVVGITDKLLGEKTKDLRLATWGTVGKMNLRGWVGLAEGVSVYHALIKEFWPTMFPDAKRARGRANLFTWMGDQIAAFFETKDVTLSDGDAVRGADELLNEIDSMLAEKLGDVHPGPGKLRGLMRDKVRAIPEPPPPPPEDTGQGDGSADQQASDQTNEASGGGGIAITSLADIDQGLLGCAQALVTGARVLREADITNPIAYRLQRLGIWLNVHAAPQNNGGATDVYGFDGGVLGQLSEFVSTEQWDPLLRAAEEATAASPFWFLPHRCVAMAMDKLGGAYAAARQTVGREVAAFASRLPALLSLSFNDGAPFADPETRAWVQEEQKKFGGAGGNAAADKEDEELAKRFDAAREMVRGGSVGDGLALALALANRGADARMRFRAQLSVARLALDANKPAIAKPLLEMLLTQAEQHHLEIWEPGLCATLYSDLLLSLRSAPGEKSPEAIQKEAFVFDKLCRFDPAAAMRLSGS